MITATSQSPNYVTQLTDGKHVFYADTPLAGGGSDLYQRPGDILASALAACVNITTRMLLEEQSLPYRQVTVQVDLDRSDPDHPILTAHVDIQGDILPEQKAAILSRVTRCPVCQFLRAPAQITID